MKTPSGIGKEDENNDFPENTVYGEIQLRLLDLADTNSTKSGFLFNLFGLFK